MKKFFLIYLKRFSMKRNPSNKNIIRAFGSLMNFTEPFYGSRTFRENDVDAAWKEVGQMFEKAISDTSRTKKDKVA